MATFRAVLGLRPLQWLRVARHCRFTTDLDIAPLLNNGHLWRSTVHCGEKKANCRSHCTAASGFKEERDALDMFIDENLVKSPSKQKAKKGKTVTNSFKELQSYVGSTQNVDVSQLRAMALTQVVNKAVLPTSPPDMRYHCLHLVLSQENDLVETETILKATLNDMHALPIKVVVDIIQALSRAGKTPLRTEVRKKLILGVVNHRFYEITPSQVTFLMYELDKFFNMRQICAENRLHNKFSTSSTKAASSTTSDNNAESTTTSQHVITIVDSTKQPEVQTINFESRVLALSDQINIKDVSRILQLLGKWKNRNEPLLRAVIHRLSRDEFSSFNFTQMANIMYACKLLYLHDTQVFSQICKALKDTQPPNLAVALSLVSSLALLRWRDEALIQSVMDFLCERAAAVTPDEAVYLTASLALLLPGGLSPAHRGMVGDLANKTLNNTANKINFVYSLAVLDILTAQMAESVLKPDFVEQFLSSRPAQIPVMQRLVCVHTAAQLKLSDYTGPLCSEKALTAMTGTPQASAQDRALSSALLNAVSKFALPETYTKKPDDLPLGVTADLIMCANSKGAVRPLTQDNRNPNEQLHKLALSVVSYSNVIFPDQTPIGSQVFNARLLAKCGYIPVQVLYSDLRPNLSHAEHVNNVKQRIEQAVTGALAGSTTVNV